MRREKEEKEEKVEKEECLMHEIDAEGDPNLCCCYLVDSNGRYIDPCYHPVTACC